MFASKLASFIPKHRVWTNSNQFKITSSTQRASSTAKATEFEETKSEELVAKNSNVNNDEFGNDFASSVPDFEEAIEREENFRRKVEQLRDVSRFSKVNALKKHRQELPVLSELQEHYLKKERFYRKLYSRLGKSSGVEPGVAWPHKQELENIIKEEKEYDLTLEQKINILIERKKEKYEQAVNLEKETDDLLAKMPKQIESYFQRIVKKQKLDEEKLNKKREILDQAREFYGYEVDLRDMRVQEMVKKIGEEKKAAEKLKKKEEEKKKMLTSSLQQKLKESEKALKKQQQQQQTKSEEAKKNEPNLKASNQTTELKK